MPPDDSNRSLSAEQIALVRKWIESGAEWQEHWAFVPPPREVELPLVPGAHRVLNVHRNEPGVLRDINRIVADTGANVESQYLGTRDEIGYLIMDVERGLSGEVKRRIDTLDASIRTRLLF